MSENDQILSLVIGGFSNASALASKLNRSLDDFQNADQLLELLYQARGTLLFPFLEGEFLVLIWDKTRHRFLLARDPLGHHNLYYLLDGDAIWFAPSAAQLAKQV